MARIAKSKDVLLVLIAHSHPVIRQGIDTVVRAEPDLVVVRAVGDGLQAVAEIRRRKPDMAIVEFNLPYVDGLHMVAMASREGLATRVLLLSEECQGSDVYQAMTAGAIGYLSTRDSVEDICRAIRRGSVGRRTFSNVAVTALQDYLQQQAVVNDVKVRAAAGRPLLTGRELQVLQCIAEGISIAQTGRRLHMSGATIRNHRHSVFAKLGVANAPAAVYVGMCRGLLPAGVDKKAS